MPGSRRTVVPKFGVSDEMRDPPDTSWIQMQEVKPDYGILGRKEKSLWAEWRERRAAKKAAGTETVHTEPED